MNTPTPLTSRAAALSAASKTILPLACAATASAATLNFDFFGAGLYDNSGFFASTVTLPATGGGMTQGTGFKLYGSSTIADSAFYRYDENQGEFLPRFDGDGLALLWGGSISGSLSAGDVLSAPFDFSYAFTHTPAQEGDTYISNQWKLTLGLVEWNDEQAINWATEAPNYPFASANTDGYESIAGTFSHTGTLDLTVEQWMLDSYAPTNWFVRLEVLVNHENASDDYEPPYPKWNGDTLAVTVPQNSIDLAYSPIPEPSSILIASAGGLLVFRRRRKP